MSWSAIAVALPAAFQLLFFAAVGACVGSLTNVLAYRMPRGLDVVLPASRCPSCRTKLTWRENIPIFGWLLLRGRCRFCSVRVSAEYPVVETIVAGLFALFFVLWYLVPPDAVLLGLEIGDIAPLWTRNGLVTTWPPFVALLFLLGSLVAMTIIDARTYTIPLVLTWVPAAAAAILHTAHAAWFTLDHGPLRAVTPTETGPAFFLAADGFRWVTTRGWTWTLATPNPSQWGWIGAGLGGMLGIALSLLLVRLGGIRRSFADYEKWEAQAIADAEREDAASPATAESGRPADDNAAHLWIQYPHARREMVIESAFASPIVLGMIAGGALLPRLAPAADAPLWLAVLAGVCLGYLIGGGAVWAVRIFGSLAFNKEAMGMGDVHLMAAVGACCGWIDADLGFFGAAFVGLAYTVAALIVGGRLKRAMPFGPFLAVSTVIVLLGKPWIEDALTAMLHAASRVDLP
jgi:leader peptidase (prepilin peptidase)/N-methyltransferase